MLKRSSSRLTYANVVSTIALVFAVTGGSMAVAHGVRHARFAHNAGKLDGIDSRAFQKRCKNGSILAYARVDVTAVSTTALTSAGITHAYNCRSAGNPALVRKSGGDGVFYVRFPRLMRGNPLQNYVAVANVEGTNRTINMLRSSIDGVPVISAYIYNASSNTFENVHFSITLIRVAR